jgi:hypothetical protein
MDELSHAQAITYDDVWLLGGARTPFADYNGGQGVAILLENPEATT